MKKQLNALWVIQKYFTKGINKKIFVRYLLLLALMCLFSLLTYCNSPTEPMPPKEISLGILPLKVGYSWTYRDYDLREDGSINTDIPYTEFKYLIKSSKTISVESQNYLVFSRVLAYTYNQNYSNSEWLFRNFDDGLYAMGGKMPTDSIFTKLLKYKYPVQKGETWGSPYLVYDLYDGKYVILDTVTYTCTDTDAVFETPIGNFSCTVYYHREDLDDDVLAKADIYEYYSANVGLVGVITYSFFEYNQESYPNTKRILTSTNVLNN